MLARLGAGLARGLGLAAAAVAFLWAVWLRGRAAGRAQAEARAATARARSITTAREIRDEVLGEDDAALDRRIRRWLRDPPG